MNPWPLIRAELRRGRLGAGAIILLVALAVALGVAVTGQERALRRGSARAADAFDLLIGAPGSPTQLVLTTVYLQEAALPLIPGDILTRLAADPGVRMAAPIAFGDSVDGYPIIGTIPDFAGHLAAPSEGRPFESHEEAVIGASVLLPLGSSVTPMHGRGDAASGQHSHAGVGYRIVGRLARTGTPWDRAILVPIESVWEIHALGTGHQPGSETLGPPFDGETVPGVPAIVVIPNSVSDAYTLRSTWRKQGLAALFPAEVLTELYATLGDVRRVLTAMSIATQGLVVASVLLAVLATLAARRRQIAILRALGAPRRFILLTVWAQVSLLVSLGGVLGLVLGWGSAWIVSLWLGRVTGVFMPVELGGEEIMLVMTVIGLGGLLALIPAIMAYRQPVLANLRS